MLLAFLAFVVLLAGFVAYAADNIARRAGRRHLRLFGLRPKTTALIVAVAAGMAISLASMLAFFALNRQAIRNIEQADLLRAQLNGLKKDVVSVQSDLKSAQAERDSANARAEQARAANLKASAQLTQAQTALGAARADTDTLEAQASGLQSRVSRLSMLRATLEAQALQNRQKLASSQAELSSAQSRASGLDARLGTVQRQITRLDAQNEQAQAQAQDAQAQAQKARAQAQNAQTQARTAKAQAQTAQTQVAQAQGRVTGLQAQLRQLDDARQAVTQQRDQAASQLGQLQSQLEAAQQQARQAQLSLSGLTAQRDAVRKDLGTLKQTVAGLQAQSLALKNDNDTLRLRLSSSQADVQHLEDEYSRATSELSASRNTDLSYSKNSIVYGGVVASVRSLDSFLDAASAAATAHGARGTPAAQLAAASRQVLEATLRGLNASTYVLCRASGNTAAGFAVDLTCDARPNTLLYAHGSVIRKATISLQGGDEALRGQLQDLIGDAVLDLTRRGVPVENVLNGGLNTASLYSLLSRLAARGGSTAVVGVMPRSDVKPSSQVDLYADIVQ